MASLEQLTARVELLEEIVNKIQIALTNVASTEAISQILLLKQTDISDLKVDVEALYSQINLLREEVFK